VRSHFEPPRQSNGSRRALGSGRLVVLSRPAIDPLDKLGLRLAGSVQIELETVQGIAVAILLANLDRTRVNKIDKNGKNLPSITWTFRRTLVL
jgi:hypothetical protein